MDPGSTEPSRPPRRFTRRAHDAATTLVVEVYDEQDREVADDLGRLALFTLDRVSSQVATQLDVTLVDSERMTVLNREHMGQDEATDVLAFPLDLPGEGHDGVPSFLGDVVICPDVATAQARAVGHPVEQELHVLLVHGILHLLGHDHAEDRERRVMFGLTDEILSAFASEGSALAGDVTRGGRGR